jgi:DNA-binding LacI/PurR family transcriptional regulator
MQENRRGRKLKRSRRLSQADIAERLGISVSTVSRALANESTISLPVREEVRQLARTLGYRGKKSGGSLIDRSVCALVPLGGATSGLSGFYFGIAEGMRDAAHQVGMTLDVRLIDESSTSLDLMRRYVADSGASALLLAGIDATDALVEWSREEDLPVILVNGADPSMRLSSVAPANFYGAYRATERLLDAGHRRLLHYTHGARPTILERRRGYESALASVAGAEGIVLRSADVTVAELTSRLLAEAYDVTGLFIWNDIVAVQVVEALGGVGPRLARRYAVVGFDDLPIASLSRPRLSTMHVDREAIGRAAIHLLRARFEGDRTVQQLEIGVTPVEGDTIFQR